MHLLPEKILRALTRKAQSEPTAAATALACAKKLRETLFALVTGIVSGSAPPKNTLALLRQHWIAGINAHELVAWIADPDGNRICLHSRKDGTAG